MRLALVPLLATAPLAAQDLSFGREVLPILSHTCFACHGPDAKARKADLSLYERAVVLEHKDEILHRITATDDDRMPPVDSGKRLSGAQVDTLKRWLAAGAPWGRHWSFEPVRRPQPPAVQDAAWPASDLDRFVLRRLEAEGLRPSPPAPRAALIRRLSLDLTGLPPTPEEVAAFEADDDPGAYEALVDRLLQRPTYGEHQALMWLDLARYADTKGYEKDRARTIWPYRDWVIRSFNADLPFDVFTRDQLAGDLLEHPTEEQRIATAFHRNTLTNEEGGTDDEEFRVAAVKDRIETTMQVWMGLTMACANCHTHKFDPISQHEYYGFFALFNQTEDADRHDEAPTMVLATPAQRQQLVALDAQIAARSEEVKAAGTPPGKDAGLRQLRAERRKIPVTNLPVMRELPAGKRRKTHVHVRGNFLSKGDEVQPGVPAAFGPLPEGAPPNRLGVAQWLTRPDNPLTARVTANRWWARFFGRGIVETQEDFGTQGAMPTHPDLLDWLAAELVHNGWSIKRLCKTVVMSATYRQRSDADPELLRRDPFNLLLARGPAFRLGAEAIRDSALAVSGLLSDRMYGPSVMPPQPDGIWQSIYNATKWQTSTGEDRWRRGLYTYAKRTSGYPASLTFDAPTREICCLRRIPTNTPLQALVTLNDPAYVEAAQAMARRLLHRAGDDAARLGYGLRLVTARAPRPDEAAHLRDLLGERRRHYRGDAAAATAMATDPLGPAPAGSDVAELAAWTVVCNVLLNLDEFLVKR